MNYFKLILILCIAHINIALASDSIKIVNPVYASSLEKSLFEDYIQNKKTDAFLMSLYLDTTLSKTTSQQYLTQIQNFIDENEDKIQKMTSEKSKINFITKVANKEYLKNFDNIANTSDLFKNGKFNLISAWVFYSYVFEKLKIPYTVNDVKGSFSFIAYPSSSAISIKFKKLTFLDFQPDQELINLFMDFLLDSKIISKSELSKKGIEGAFNEHYYSSSNLSQIDLVGLQYFNNAVENINKQDFRNAVNNLEKSYILSKSDRTLFALNQTLIEIVQEDSFSDFDNMDYFSKLVTYARSVSVQDYVKAKFSLITNDYLVTSNRIDLYDKIYNRLDTDVENKEMKKQIADIYHTNKARYFIMKQEYENSWSSITKGYKNNPENLETIELMQQLFLELSSKKLRSTDFENYFFPKIKEYPILTKNDKILSMGGFFYAQKIHDQYFYDDKVSGDKTMEELENYLKQYNYQPNSFIIGISFGEAASYYYRKHDHKKCKAILDRGLEISPGNDDLIRKYRINYPNEGK